MNKKLYLELTLCPSVNHAYLNRKVFCGRNRAYMSRMLSTEARTWKERAGWAAKQEMKKQGFTMIPEKTKFVLEVWVTWVDGRHGDCSNLFKLLEDALKGVAFFDDKYCLPRVMNFKVDKTDPKLQVAISLLEGTDGG